MSNNTEDNECPICFEKYGEQIDGSFLCRDGKDNSDYAENCIHYICVKCCMKMVENCNNKCPICREDWSEFLYERYEDYEEEEGYQEDDD